MEMVSDKEIEAARAVLERRIYDEGGCEAQQVPAMVREMLEAAARVRAEANNGCGEAVIPAPQPSGPVQVKPLEWEENHSKRSNEDPTTEVVGFEAETAFGTFYTIEVGAAMFHVIYDYRGLGQFETEREAKAAAQADYERRILSALTAGKPEQAVPSVAEAERERIANALEEEADTTPCSEDAVVVRDCARLVRANFSYEDAERLAEEAPAAPTAGGGDAEVWQPIETAPKDGTQFQAWIEKYGWEPRARFNPDSEAFELWGRVDYDKDGWDVYPHMVPTHWMPLPTPPTAGGGDDV